MQSSCQGPLVMQWGATLPKNTPQNHPYCHPAAESDAPLTPVPAAAVLCRAVVCVCYAGSILPALTPGASSMTTCCSCSPAVCSWQEALLPSWEAGPAGGQWRRGAGSQAGRQPINETSQPASQQNQPASQTSYQPRTPTSQPASQPGNLCASA